MITAFFSPKRRRGASAADDRSGEKCSVRERVTSLARATTNTDGDDEHKSSKRFRTEVSPVGAVVSPPALLCPEVEELLSYFSAEDGSSGDGGESVGKKMWREALWRHVSALPFASLAKFVASERKSRTVYPPPNDTFSALNLTPLSKVKVVVVGQDPYHGPGQGHGLAFSVRRGVAIPPSLRNMYKELLNDDAVPEFGRIPSHGYLERWARQGVLMLNAALTVRRGEANSHAKRGWENFTDEVIKAVDRESGPKGVVFLLWGKPASKKAESVISKGRGRHTVICTSHPSPLGATKTKSPFLGSRCFSRANTALKERGFDPIDWNVDGPPPDGVAEDV